MKIERTTKITLNNADQSAVGTTMDIISEIADKMDGYDVLEVYGNKYDQEYIETVKNFLSDLWHNGDCACEIKED